MKVKHWTIGEGKETRVFKKEASQWTILSTHKPTSIPVIPWPVKESRILS